MIPIKGISLNLTIPLSGLYSLSNLTILFLDDHIEIFIINNCYLWEHLPNHYDQFLFEHIKKEGYLRHFINYIGYHAKISYINNKDIRNIEYPISYFQQLDKSRFNLDIPPLLIDLNNLLKYSNQKILMDRLFLIDNFQLSRYMADMQNYDNEFNNSYLAIEKLINMLFDKMIHIQKNGVFIDNLKKYKTMHHKIDMLYTKGYFNDSEYEDLDIIRVTRNNYVHYQKQIDEEIVKKTRSIILILDKLIF